MPRRKPNGSNQARPENWPELRHSAIAFLVGVGDDDVAQHADALAPGLPETSA